MTSQITRDAEHLSAAQRAMRAVKTHNDAIAWLNNHYWPLIEIDALHDELVAMHRAIVERVTGVGAG